MLRVTNLIIQLTNYTNKIIINCADSYYTQERIMLKARDFRNRAWNKLQGNWATAVVSYLIMELIIGALAFTFIGSFLIIGPLTVGFSLVAVNIVRKNNPQIENLFAAFNDFVRTFVLWIINTVFIALWSLLFVIPGIIKALSYSMSYYIVIDNTDMSANEARKRSMQMMEGHKWSLFCLYCSFIGWILLGILTFGILLFWVLPYIEVARVEFYQNLIGADREEVKAIEYHGNEN